MASNGGGSGGSGRAGVAGKGGHIAPVVVVGSLDNILACCLEAVGSRCRLITGTTGLRLRRTGLLDLRPELRALAVVVEAFVTMGAGTLPELFRGIGERLLRREPLVRPPASEVLAISPKLFKFFLSSSILLWSPMGEVLLHLS